MDVCVGWWRRGEGDKSTMMMSKIVCVCVYIYICVSVCINPDMEKGGVVHTEMPIEAAFLVKMQKS